MATLSDVAAAAGVSPTAVSRYLNRRIDLPKATRDRIDAAIVKLDYRPNLLAKRLSTGRTEAISIVAPDIGDPFFAELAAAIEQEAAYHGYAVFMSSTGGEREREVAAVKRLRDQHVDGLVMITNHPDDGVLAELLARRDNVVLLDEDIASVHVPKLFVENENGAYLATKYLIGLGHTDIAMIGGPDTLLSGSERRAGFLRAMGEAGLTVRHEWQLIGDYARAFGQSSALKLMGAKRRPTAIFAGSDYLAIGVLQAMRQLELSVPNDLSLVGFDDTPFAELVDPPLTTVRQPITKLGQLAFRYLLAVLRRESAPALTRLPVELIVRKSAIACSKTSA